MLYILIIITTLHGVETREATTVMDVTKPVCEQQRVKLQKELPDYQVAQCVELDME
jgi:hypothetical protein